MTVSWEETLDFYSVNINLYTKKLIYNLIALFNSADNRD
ncbi:hypothetical protein Ple7327_0077 [Pleurocapsa sp. PCC 7327]|nr:hypothetical protein Ple7327_0077 [Pleurocapsa sp. PCC 7327]